MVPLQGGFLGGFSIIGSQRLRNFANEVPQFVGDLTVVVGVPFLHHVRGSTAGNAWITDFQMRQVGYRDRLPQQFSVKGELGKIKIGPGRECFQVGPFIGDCF